ncbi:hypothetical protein ACFL3I_06745 [Pseudomonadota bacterium]
MAFNKSDRTQINNIHTRTFAQEQGPEIAELVNDLLDDAGIEGWGGWRSRKNQS